VPFTSFVPFANSWWPILREGFSGAWQRGIVTPIEDAATHPIFWACVTQIANDVAKMRPMLMTEVGGVLQEATSPAFSPRPAEAESLPEPHPVPSLVDPSKLTRGNAYILKERDDRGVVTALYVLDPMRCRPLVTPSGDVYYQLGRICSLD